MKEKKLKKIYFDFYDRLKPEVAAAAEIAWDYEWAKRYPIPVSITDTIVGGIRWSDNEDLDWSEIYYNLIDYLKGGPECPTPEEIGGLPEVENPEETTCTDTTFEKVVFAVMAGIFVGQHIKDDCSLEIKEELAINIVKLIT